MHTGVSQFRCRCLLPSLLGVVFACGARKRKQKQPDCPQAHIVQAARLLAFPFPNPRVHMPPKRASGRHKAGRDRKGEWAAALTKAVEKGLKKPTAELTRTQLEMEELRKKVGVMEQDLAATKAALGLAQRVLDRVQKECADERDLRIFLEGQALDLQAELRAAVRSGHMRHQI